MERYKFNCRSQKERESIAVYTAELRRLAVTCKCGANLEEMLRDRFICGLYDTKIQKALLSKKTLTFNEARETALSMELADVNSQFITKNQIPEAKCELLKFQESRACSRCGGKHAVKDCFHINTVCYVCKARGKKILLYGGFSL